MEDVEVLDGPVGRHGGARPNSGPKKGWKKSQEAVDFDKAKARHEAIKADLAEIELKSKTLEYVSRAEVREAMATAFATVSQTLRMIPDQLERNAGLSPEQAEQAEQVINETMAELAKTMQQLGCEGG